MQRTFDRLPQTDPRNSDYPIRTLMAAAVRPRSYTWSLVPRLNQGQQGACVGFAWAHELAARPVIVADVHEADAFEIYHEAQKLDEWPGESYSGTSVLAGAKVLQAASHFAEYRWATGVDDLAAAIGHVGPAVLGVQWRDGMFDPDADGTLHVTGNVLGGHAIIARGVSFRTRRFRLTNSWGRDWGSDGDCFVSFDDMARMLADHGEACIPVGRKPR